MSVKDRLNAYIEMISAYSSSGTYFVRKISAQAMLPLLKFSDFIPEIVRTLTHLQQSGNSIKQNQAHGLIVRVQIFMEAYFKYRQVAKPDCTSFVEEEAQLLDALITFQRNLVNWTKYSKVTWALFLKTLRQCLSKVEISVAQPYLEELMQLYATEFDSLAETMTDQSG